MSGFQNLVGPSPAPQSRRALEMRLCAGGAWSLVPQLSLHLPPDPTLPDPTRPRLWPNCRHCQGEEAGARRGCGFLTRSYWDTWRWGVSGDREEQAGSWRGEQGVRRPEISLEKGEEGGQEGADNIHKEPHIQRGVCPAPKCLSRSGGGEPGWGWGKGRQSHGGESGETRGAGREPEWDPRQLQAGQVLRSSALAY